MTRIIACMVVGVLLVACSSCGRQEEGGSSNKVETPEAGVTLDTSDPGAVAHAAWQAIVAEDYDAYIAHVHPESRHRETRKQWLDSVQQMKKVPAFPTDPDFTITPQEDPGRAAAVTEDFRVSMGMIFKEGRWWMD